jgi:3-carboxy-cis,cis-muconate cycloisomerase
MSEAVMMGSGPYIGREYATTWSTTCAARTVSSSGRLLDLLAEHP